MIPCLYREEETAFTDNGIGKLCDAISCEVTEKRNGSYELKLDYPADGLHAEELTEGAVIHARPSETAVSQPFRIYKVTTPLSGLLSVQARHLQYLENFITVSPFSAVGCEATLTGLKKNAASDCPFTFWTDIDSKAVFSLLVPATVRNCLGGMEGSLLDVFGGEFEWDGYRTLLHAHRGRDNGVRIVYGKNLIDFQMEKNIENVITGVHPYWKHSEDGTLVQLSERIVTVKDHGKPYEKITPLDCTSQFEEVPTESQLRGYAQTYLENTALTEPDVDVSINFAQLWQTPGYADIAAAERVGLCDTVHVYIPKLDVEVSCKVTETVYDTLLERYKSITLSNASIYSKNSSLSGALGSIRDEANLATEAINRVETSVTDVRTIALQQEYFNQLAAGLFGLYYSSGLEEDGSTIRYAHTGEELKDSKYAWKSSSKGFFLSTDGGATWEYGRGLDRVLVSAVDAVGVKAESILSGILKTELVKILGTENFYWQDGAIVMTEPDGGKKQIRIGQYREGKYGIAVSSDEGATWKTALDFDGLNETSGGDASKEEITRSAAAPVNPVLNALWVDTGAKRLKLWDGKAWIVIGYEPPETPTEPEPPIEPETPMKPTQPENPDNTEGGGA